MTTTTVTSSGVPTENGTDSTPSSIVSPLQQNRTYLDINDPDFQDWLKNQDEETRNRVEAQVRNFERLNRGTHKNRSFTYNGIQRRIDDWNSCHAIGCQLELAEWEKKAIFHIVDSLDMKDFKKYDKFNSTEKRKKNLIAYCAAILLHNDRQTNDKGRYHPNRKLTNPQKWDGLWRPCEGPKDRPYLFKKLAEDLGFEDNTVVSCLEKLRDEIEVNFSKAQPGHLSTVVLEDSDCWSEYIKAGHGI